MRRYLLCVLAVLAVATCSASAQTVELAGTTLAIGTAPTSPSGTSVRLDNLGASGGTLVLLTDTDGDVFERVLAKSDLPGTVGYTDEAETWSLLQTFTSGLTSNGLVTIGGANDLLLGTGGLRAPSGSILLRNIADSANIATFGDSAITLVQPVSASSTLGVTGLSTLTGGFTSSAASQVNSTLGITGLTTAALIRTTGVYGVASPFTVYASDGVTSRLEVADGGPVLLTDTGTDSYLRLAATGASAGKRQWRAGTVNGNYMLSAGNDAADTWTTLAYGTSTAGVANGWYWGTAVAAVDPLLSYTTALGNDIYKYLSLSAAELKVGTIVAQDYIATIGGRVMVAPTTQLTSDLASGATTMLVEHNEMTTGDQVLLEGGGKVEFIQIDSTGLGTGGGDSIARKGAATAAADTVALPTHVSGDYIVILAYRAGSNTAPSLPAGYTTVCASSSTNNVAFRIGYKVAASVSETSGTWTNATHLHALVYEGVTGFGACDSTEGTTATLTYPALTMTDNDGSSYVVRMGMSNPADSTAEVPSGGYALIQTQSGASRNSSTFQSSAGMTSVTSTTVTLASSGNNRGISLELLGTIDPATGPFSYTITRNRDGTGANDWYKGDAVLNTGTTGDGFWDIYSIQPIAGGVGAGPTMCANERTGAGYAAWANRFCAGNLRSLYGNAASNLYGIAFGNYADVWGQMDATNGLRFFEGSTNQKLRIDPTGYVLLGTSGSGQANAYIDNTELLFRRGTVEYVEVSSAGLVMGDGTNTRITLDATNGLLLGRTASGQGNILADTTGNLILRSGTVNRITLDASNSTFNILDDDGATSRVQIGSTVAYFGATSAARLQFTYATGTIALYKPDGTVGVRLDATDGITIGDIVTGSRAYMQLSGSNLSMCRTTVFTCTLVFDGTTGNITSTGSVTLATGGDILSTGNFSLSNANGLRFSQDTAFSTPKSVQWGNPSSGAFAQIMGYTSGQLNLRSHNGTATANLELYRSSTYHTLVLGITAVSSQDVQFLPPDATGTSRIGNSSVQWDSVYATTYYAGTTAGYSGTIAVSASCNLVVSGGIVTNYSGVCP